MSDAPLSLDALAAKAQKSRKALSQSELDHAARLLADELPRKDATFPNTIALARKFPPQAARTAVRFAWPTLSDSEKEGFCAALSGSELKDPQFRSFAFHIAAELAALDAGLSREVLRIIAGNATDDGRKAPGLKDSASFRDAFISEVGLELLDLSGEIQATIPPFLRLILGSAFDDGTKGKSHVPVDAQQRVLSWLLKGNLWSRLPAIQQTRVIEALREWHEDELNAFRKENAALPFDLPAPRPRGSRAVEMPAANAPPQEQPAPQSERSSEPQSAGAGIAGADGPISDTEKILAPASDAPRSVSEGPLPTPQNPESPSGAQALPRPPQTFSALVNELKRLWEVGETERADKNKQNRDLEVEIRQLRKQLEEAQKEGNGWRTQFHAEQDKLTVLREELDRTKTEATTAREESTRLDGELKTEKEAHEADARRLLETIDIEKRREVDAFRNRVASALRAEHANFESVRSAPMEADLGEGLRALLTRLFEALKKEDIKL